MAERLSSEGATLANVNYSAFYWTLDLEQKIADYAVGEFQFHEVSGGTEVQWTYSFHKRSWLITPVVSWVVQNDFAEFMRSALQTMKEAAEQDLSEDVIGD